MKHYRFTQHIVSISNSRGSRICGICAKLLPFPSEVNHELNKRAQISYTIGVRNQDLLTVGRRIRGVGIRNRPHLGDLELVEDVLKNFVVLDHLVLRLGVEVDLVHRHRPRVRRVHQLARHRPRRSLHETHTQIKSPHQEPRKKKSTPRASRNPTNNQPNQNPRGRKSAIYLLDLGEAELQGGVDPRQDLVPPHEVGPVHHPDVARRHLLRRREPDHHHHGDRRDRRREKPRRSREEEEEIGDEVFECGGGGGGGGGGGAGLKGRRLFHGRFCPRVHGFNGWIVGWGGGWTGGSGRPLGRGGGDVVISRGRGEFEFLGGFAFRGCVQGTAVKELGMWFLLAGIITDEWTQCR